MTTRAFRIVNKTDDPARIRVTKLNGATITTTHDLNPTQVEIDNDVVFCLAARQIVNPTTLLDDGLGNTLVTENGDHLVY